MIGGGVRIPLVQKTIEDYFGANSKNNNYIIMNRNGIPFEW